MVNGSTRGALELLSPVDEAGPGDRVPANGSQFPAMTPAPQPRTNRAPRCQHRGWIWTGSLVAHAIALAALVWWSQAPAVEDDVLVHATLSQYVEQAALSAETTEPEVEPEPEQLPVVEIEETPLLEEELEIVDPESEITAIEPRDPMPLLSPDAFRRPVPAPIAMPDAPPAVVVQRRPPPVAKPARRPAKRGGTLRLVRRPDVSTYYPYEARSQNIQGETIVLIEVDSTGHVVRATVRQSSGYVILDDAALRVAYAHLFAPGVTGRAELPVRFRLVG